MFHDAIVKWLYFRSTPRPVTVTTGIITFLVGNPYKPSFATVTGWGVDPSYMFCLGPLLTFRIPLVGLGYSRFTCYVQDL